ncbi:phage major tail tube protein [Camelimonas lactis]|uniref:Phage tail tube protein FII n=1 Tax=Camelimonas lactis TaxID=659006 RepID=A0A4R2GWP5_9HYPH|nr:phage major tail tube protein [Camelimonas lactis]TCO15224.1 phage tail tube protein FII [Camelimonas lactis]
MDAVKIGQLTNAEVYLNDNRCVGRFKSIDVPKLEYETVKHASLGMVAELEVPSRQLKSMKGKGDSQWLDPDVTALFSVPNRAVSLTLDGYTDIFGPDGLIIEQGFRCTWHLTMLVGSNDAGSIKFGNDFKGAFEYSALRFVERNSRNPIPTREVDVMAQINRANGIDVWPTY